MTPGFELSANAMRELAELKHQVEILRDAVGSTPTGRVILRQHLAKVGGTAITKLTSGSPDTFGSGDVTLYKRNDSNQSVAVTDSSGTDIEVTVYSFASEDSGTNTYVWVGQDNLGTWWYLNEAC